MFHLPACTCQRALLLPCALRTELPLLPAPPPRPAFPCRWQPSSPCCHRCYQWCSRGGGLRGTADLAAREAGRRLTWPSLRGRGRMGSTAAVPAMAAPPPLPPRRRPRSSSGGAAVAAATEAGGNRGLAALPSWQRGRRQRPPMTGKEAWENGRRREGGRSGAAAVAGRVTIYILHRRCGLQNIRPWPATLPHCVPSGTRARPPGSLRRRHRRLPPAVGCRPSRASPNNFAASTSLHTMYVLFHTAPPCTIPFFGILPLQHVFPQRRNWAPQGADSAGATRRHRLCASTHVLCFDRRLLVV